MRRFAALLLASNGPGTWLPWRFWCGQVLRKNRWSVLDKSSSEIQMCCGMGGWSDCTARRQAIGGRRIKRAAGHENGRIAFGMSKLPQLGLSWQALLTKVVRALTLAFEGFYHHDR
jgi:hypothetical protein